MHNLKPNTDYVIIGMQVVAKREDYESGGFFDGMSCAMNAAMFEEDGSDGIVADWQYSGRQIKSNDVFTKELDGVFRSGDRVEEGDAFTNCSSPDASIPHPLDLTYWSIEKNPKWDEEEFIKDVREWVQKNNPFKPKPPQKKFSVRVTRNATESVDIEVIAASAEAANIKALEMAGSFGQNLTGWETDDNSSTEVYIPDEDATSEVV